MRDVVLVRHSCITHPRAPMDKNDINFSAPNLAREGKKRVISNLREVEAV